MHKPVYILVNSKTDKEARKSAEVFMQDLCNEDQGASHDWFQGLKESQRWNPERYYFDKPRSFDDKHSKRMVTKTLRNQKAEILNWIKEGNKALKTKKGMDDLGWTLTQFSIASGRSVVHLFDHTGYSAGEGIVDRNMLKHILKYAKQQCMILWWVGFDVHY